ncbi:MAG: NADP-dependent malic enzyme [archaeon]
MDIQQESLEMHKKLKGKLEITSKIPIKTRKDLSLAYTPGVAEASREIAKDKEKVYTYTMKGNTVGIVSDGSAVLGLGNIGAEAALPVMEGKAVLFKELADINAVPLCLATHDPKSIVETVRNLAPNYGAILLEDIKAPECFVIEAALQDLGIPVMHDDQHGTAVVVLAVMINALKAVGKRLDDVKMVINGAGAAGIAVAKIMLASGLKSENTLVLDSRGTLYEDRPGLDPTSEKGRIAARTNPDKIDGRLEDAVKDADVFLGVSVRNILTKEMVQSMGKDAVVIAMANPDPEIMPDVAKEAGATVVATGRSDFPNQVNNVLGFPGLFRGALDARAPRITERMKVAAAFAIADLIDDPTPDRVIPDPLDERVVPAVAKAVTIAWAEEKDADT